MEVNYNNYTPHFALFVAGPVTLLFLIIQAASAFLEKALGKFWLVVHPWLSGICITIMLVCLTVFLWHVIPAFFKRYHAHKISAAAAQEAQERAVLAQEQTEQARKQTALTGEIHGLIADARVNGDNVKIAFKDGGVSSVEVIRASSWLEAQRGRVQIAETPQPPRIGAANAKNNILPAVFPAPADFADVLETFRPSREGIYLMNTVEGSITEKVRDLTHIGLTGPTGGGKTNINRLVTSQVLSCGGYVYMASPNFAPVKLNKDHLEDWRPIMRYLKAYPAQTKEQIEALIQAFLDLFEKRKAAEQKNPRRGSDVFLILGEWPGIAARVKDAPEKIGLLLRESRQYGIHILTEMQDALVKTTQIDTGMIENLRTGAYSGGDKATAKRILDLKEGQVLEEPQELGKKGAIWLRSYANGLNSGRVPFFSNKSMYELLGYPPDPITDETIYDDRQIPEVIADYKLVDPSTRGRRWGGTGSPENSRFYSISGESLYSAQTLPDIPKKETSTGPLASQADTLVVQSEVTSEEVPDFGPDNYYLTDLQVKLFITYYEDCGNISDSLARIKNEKGQGLGGRYFKHASWLVKKYNLKKRG